MRLLLATLCLAPLLLAACDSTDGPGPPSASLRYTLQLQEENATVATGELNFAARPQAGATSIAGTYALAWTDSTDLPPNGTFGGSYETDSLIVRIAPPEAADTGIRLAGTYSATSYTGTWYTLTIAGPVARGAFSATPVAN